MQDMAQPTRPTLYFAKMYLSRGSLPLNPILHCTSHDGPTNCSHFGILEFENPGRLQYHNAIMKFRSEIHIGDTCCMFQVVGTCNVLIYLFSCLLMIMLW